MMTTQTFLNALQTFQHIFEKTADTENQINEKISHLKQHIKQKTAHDLSLQKQNPLAQSIAELNIAIEQGFNDWDEKIQATRPMKALSEAYSDRIIFLVFGKVNAGKSSLSNFIAELFPENEVKRFRFHQGQVSYFKEGEKFAEGFTETTVEIQGVELGRNFVLIDSPGLHSVKGENGDLTRRFVDSTDAILWLTPSTSPGQVQELNDLKDELAKKKPLLPIITRSDKVDEDWCDIQNEIIKTLKNKTIENRKLQNDDVFSRLQDFEGLASAVDEHQQAVLQKPTSISIHAYTQSEKKTQDLIDSGLEELFIKLTALIDKAAAFKQKKASRQVTYFLNDAVISTLDDRIKPAIQSTLQSCQATANRMAKNQQRINAEITSAVCAEVGAIVDKYKGNKDKQSIINELNILVTSQLNHHLSEELSELLQNVQNASIALSSQNVGDFEENSINVKRVKGIVENSGSSGGLDGAKIGEAIGSVFGSAGASVGRFIGGLFGGSGSKASFSVETEMVTEVIGVSSENVVHSLVEILEQEIPKQVNQAFAQVIDTLKPVEQSCIELKVIIDKFCNDVRNIS